MKTSARGVKDGAQYGRNEHVASGSKGIDGDWEELRKGFSELSQTRKDVWEQPPWGSEVRRMFGIEACESVKKSEEGGNRSTYDCVTYTEIMSGQFSIWSTRNGTYRWPMLPKCISQ
jgi:hypothetical protein